MFTVLHDSSKVIINPIHDRDDQCEVGIDAMAREEQGSFFETLERGQ
jgi:hypothetical protein